MREHGPGPRTRRVERRQAPRAGAALALTLGVVVLAGGCARRRGVDGPPGAARGAPAGAAAQTADIAAVYERMGLVTSRDQLPFVASVSYLAGPSADSTLVLVAVSMSNSALTFAREGDRYRAPYEVRLATRRDGALVHQLASQEIVRVPTFKETTRPDESVLFYQYVVLAPGQYATAISVRDLESGRNATEETALLVPRLRTGTAGSAGGLSTPIAVYEATPRASFDSLPTLVASARATAVFGQDAVLPVYVEGYAADAGDRLPLQALVRGDANVVLWRDTVSLERRADGLYGGTIDLPVSRIGIGVATLVLNRRDSADSARAPLFVSLGEDLPVASFEEMLSYLRYFAAPDRLRALRDTAPEARPAAWAAFLRETDPVLSTTQHEGLRDYFSRVRQANDRFRDEGMPGWLTDRGMAIVGLGEPDQIYDQGSSEVSQRGRTQIWEYRDPRVSLTFVDQSGFGRWRLTTGSLQDLQSAMRRRRSQ
jgi:GWxTD domain-containing protein